MIEIERKYIIKIPDMEVLREVEEFTESEILQIYLNSPSSVTHRIRRRGFSSGIVYTETKKRRIDKMSAVEEEREISENEFNLLSENIKTGTTPIKKKRYTFLYNGKVFELDVYPEWKSTCILETELSSREEKVDFPSCIAVLEEVTGNPAYSNAGMARLFPRERSI